MTPLRLPSEIVVLMRRPTVAELLVCGLLPLELLEKPAPSDTKPKRGIFAKIAELKERHRAEARDRQKAEIDAKLRRLARKIVAHFVAGDAPIDPDHDQLSGEDLRAIYAWSISDRYAADNLTVAEVRDFLHGPGGAFLLQAAARWGQWPSDRLGLTDPVARTEFDVCAAEWLHRQMGGAVNE